MTLQRVVNLSDSIHDQMNYLQVLETVPAGGDGPPAAQGVLRSLQKAAHLNESANDHLIAAPHGGKLSSLVHHIRANVQVRRAEAHTEDAESVTLAIKNARALT
ncbi:hypothetical protein AURDEDRAFT_165109 [Auricularia subglabra TFB-10046 SS5]|nr:hypothetical protein AURDEDRAFT_165109 [Auricularia subglabra TFB-10046 SS5]